MNSIIVRKASFNDELAVLALCQRNGLEGERSDHAWSWIWGKNRYYTKKWSIGWVLESDGVVVGFIGNIPRAYSYNGRLWIAGVARAFVVDEPFRFYALKLIAEFYQQKEADLLVFSSANSEASNVYNLTRAKIIPQKDYHKVIFWVVSPSLFIFSILRKKGLSKLLSVVGSRLFTPLLSLEMLLRRRWTNNTDFLLDIEMELVDDLTKEIDELWSKIQRDNPERLLSYRDREIIKWQFSNDSAETREPVTFCLRKKKILVGYIIITRADSPEYNLKRMMITDLIAINDDPEVIRALIKEAFFYAKKNKMAILQMGGFPPIVRCALKPLYPFIHTLNYFPFWYYVINPELKEKLQVESAWYASDFDGDSTI